MKKIARELHVSRYTVRKILRSGETDFSDERERPPISRIGPWQHKLDEFLQGNSSKPSRVRLTLIRIFEVQGHSAIGPWKAPTRGEVMDEAHVPLSCDPGAACQFDWSHEIILMSGVTVTETVAHVRQCHRRMMFVRADMRGIEPLSAIGPWSC